MLLYYAVWLDALKSLVLEVSVASRRRDDLRRMLESVTVGDSYTSSIDSEALNPSKCSWHMLQRLEWFQSELTELNSCTEFVRARRGYPRSRCPKSSCAVLAFAWGQVVCASDAPDSAREHLAYGKVARVYGLDDINVGCCGGAAGGACILGHPYGYKGPKGGLAVGSRTCAILRDRVFAMVLGPIESVEKACEAQFPASQVGADAKPFSARCHSASRSQAHRNNVGAPCVHCVHASGEEITPNAWGREQQCNGCGPGASHRSPAWDDEGRHRVTRTNVTGCGTETRGTPLSIDQWLGNGNTRSSCHAAEEDKGVCATKAAWAYFAALWTRCLPLGCTRTCALIEAVIMGCVLRGLQFGLNVSWVVGIGKNCFHVGRSPSLKNLYGANCVGTATLAQAFLFSNSHETCHPRRSEGQVPRVRLPKTRKCRSFSRGWTSNLNTYSSVEFIENRRTLR